MSIYKSITIAFFLMSSGMALLGQVSEEMSRLTGRLNQAGDSIGEWLKLSETSDTLTYLNFNDKGIRHGKFMIRDSVLVYSRNLPSGRVRRDQLKELMLVTFKGNYKDGQMHGEVITLDDHDRIMTHTSYVNGAVSGMVYNYHPDGYVEYSMSYLNGEMHGESVVFHRDSGKKYRVSIYDHGTLVGRIHYMHALNESTGEYVLTSKFQYLEPGQVHDGEWKEYYKNGQPKLEHYYDNGLPTGEWKGWHENGQLSYLMVYRDNDVFFFEEYDEAGKVK